MYLVKTPFWLRAFYPSCTWKIPGTEKVIYLSFDDGPHAEATPFVLAELKKFNAKASFFCIGKNVAAHQNLYAQIIQEGHTVGNHTYDHVNGWKTDTAHYIQNIEQAGELIQSNLFRPPYGRITNAQIKKIKADKTIAQEIIMWDVLSGDFDLTLSPEACAKNVIKNTRAGSIVVFHDSAKAFERLQVALPMVLEYFSGLGYRFEAIQ
ncbi:MAG: polysaccharide deacetylase family protein [Chitinophagia bacterium]